MRSRHERPIAPGATLQSRHEGRPWRNSRLGSPPFALWGEPPCPRRRLARRSGGAVVVMRPHHDRLANAPQRPAQLWRINALGRGTWPCGVNPAHGPSALWTREACCAGRASVARWAAECASGTPTRPAQPRSEPRCGARGMRPHYGWYGKISPEWNCNHIL